jgi:hypothetical protein
MPVFFPWGNYRRSPFHPRWKDEVNCTMQDSVTKCRQSFQICHCTTESPHHPSPSTLVTWQRWGLTAVKVLTSMGRLQLLCILKTSCDFTTSQKQWCRPITTTVHLKNITLLSVFVSQKSSFHEYCKSQPRIPNDWCRKLTFRGTLHLI